MKKWPIEVDKLVFTHVVLIGAPTILYYGLRLGERSLHSLHIAIATFYLFFALVIIFETSAALFRRYATDQQKPPTDKFEQFSQSCKSALGMAGAKYPESRHPVPRCSFIVAAYLPNEQEIILETIHHLLTQVQRPTEGLEIILAYNSPMELPVEETLYRLSQMAPEFRLLRVEDSRSKAENLNAALEIVTGEITCILDADHHPAPDCLVRAWCWLEHDYHVVQGRNIIRNHGDNLLTQTIAVEFESVYGVSHAAKSFLTDTTIFGGSNGYWRTSVLQRIRFNPRMLTEDIDASMRVLLNGYRIIHDRSIITTELAPVDFQSLWFQRKRWAQGWLEVSLKYQQRFRKCKKLNPWQRLYWTYLLYCCKFCSIVALQIFPISLALFFSQTEIPPSIDTYLWLSTVLTVFSGVYQTLATMKVAAVHYPLRYFVQHSLVIFFYTTLRCSISVVALYDHLNGRNDWVVTPRETRKKLLVAIQHPSLVAPSSSGLSSTKL